MAILALLFGEGISAARWKDGGEICWRKENYFSEEPLRWCGCPASAWPKLRRISAMRDQEQEKFQLLRVKTRLRSVKG